MTCFALLWLVIPSVIQNIFSRPSTFDDSLGMYTLDDVVELHPPQIWLNVQVNVIPVSSRAFPLLLLLPQRVHFCSTIRSFWSTN
jgi:hypothetical protein